MKNYPFALIASVLVFLSCTDGLECDVCVYGGTASGVIAANAAARMGMDVIVIEPLSRIGGMTSGGLGRTDIGNKQVVRGLALDFYRKLGKHYGNLENWLFEPSAALEVMEGYLDDPHIRVYTRYHLCGIEKKGTDISSILIAGGEDTLRIRAREFIDAGYEGDLLAEAGVSFRIGREDNSEYGERYNGVQMLHQHQFPDGVDPYVEPGKPESGLLWGISDQRLLPDGTGDSLVQAYNFRICLTDSLENLIPLSKPENYDPSRYELLARLYEAQPDMRDINQYFIWSLMPGRKTDINNRGAFSTDMIGMNYNYPTASWDEREKIIRAHRDYTLGLLWFTATDPRVPAVIRDFVGKWGLPKDEYVDSDHFTPQLYVRESRRMIGEYIATQADCENRTCVQDGIALAAYKMDSHNCQRIVVSKDGRDMVKNEGDVQVPGGVPYPISYRSITPKREECTNLLVPVCCSASHIAYGSIRMEPVFMCLGQVAGMAASLAVQKHLGRIQDVDYKEINKIMSVNPYLDGRVPDVLIDDPEAEVIKGNWERKTRGKGYGPSFLIGSPDDGAVRYSATAPVTADYAAYAYFHKDSALNPLTCFSFPDGQKLMVRQDELSVYGPASGGWHYLRNLSLSKGELFSVEIGGDGRPGAPVCADAVLLLPLNQ